MSKKVLIGYGCPECKSLETKYDEIIEELYCSKCGLVLCANYHHYGVVFPGLRPVYKKR